VRATEHRQTALHKPKYRLVQATKQALNERKILNNGGLDRKILKDNGLDKRCHVKAGNIEK